jgi:hypothetical protein
MPAAKSDPAEALVLVTRALEPLDANERQWVLQSAASRWNLSATPPLPGTPLGAGISTPPFGSGGNGADVQSAIQRKDVRAFIRMKKPATDVQRVACLVYYLTQTTGQAGVSSKDIGQAHTDSGGSSINMTRALDNATRQSKYISNRGPKEKQLIPTCVGCDSGDSQRARILIHHGKQGGLPWRQR